MEPAIAPVVGRLDVQVINQHGSMGEASDLWLHSVRSAVLLFRVGRPVILAPDVLKRIVNSRIPRCRATFLRLKCETLPGS